MHRQDNINSVHHGMASGVPRGTAPIGVVPSELELVHTPVVGNGSKDEISHVYAAGEGA